LEETKKAFYSILMETFFRNAVAVGMVICVEVLVLIRNGDSQYRTVKAAGIAFISGEFIILR